MPWKGMAYAGLAAWTALAGCTSRYETSCPSYPYYPSQSETRKPLVAQIVAAFPELRGRVVTAPEWTVQLEFEAARTLPQVDPDAAIIPGQVIEVEVLGEPEFTVRRTVDVDGTIQYPLLGSLPIAGLSREEVKSEVRQRLKKYLREPNLIVNLGSRGCSGLAPSPGTPHRILVLGQVGRPGALQHERDLQVSGAIASSGWFTDQSDRREVWIIRPRIGKRPPHVVVCDFQSLLVFGDSAQDFPLGPNDIVYVPKHTTGPPQNRADWLAAARSLAGRTSTADLIAALGERR